MRIHGPPYKAKKPNLSVKTEGSVSVKTLTYGGVAERFNATVLKTVGRDERPVGSNPTASAIYQKIHSRCSNHFHFP